jgi:hypothetical protein
MTAGLVQNCIIRNNGYEVRIQGPGVRMSGGTLSHCIVRNNSTSHEKSEYRTGGGGVYASGGEVLYCHILDNHVSDGARGGGMCVNGASVVIRNTIVENNQSDDGGAGIYLMDGSIESCTIVSNSAVSGAGGVVRLSGTVINSIVYHNLGAGVPNDLNTTVGVTYCCASDGNTSDGNITDDPQFVDILAGDYHLEITSPAINAGSNQAWMGTATDLDGDNRISRSSVDLGAYEYNFPSGTVLVIR